MHSTYDFIVLPIEIRTRLRDSFRLSYFFGIVDVDGNQTRLDELMTLEFAVQRWPQLFTAIELRRAARARQFQHIHKGRKRFVTERELMGWLHQKKVGASCLLRNCSNSGVCGSDASTAANSSTGSGTRDEMERLGAAALRQRISKRQKSD
jgi:hypothetical protein